MDTKKISAEQARAYQKQLRLEQFRNRAETGTLPLQPAEPVDAFIQPGNLATKDILRDGFELRIPEWTRIAGDDDVILFINNVEVFDNPIYSVPETYIPGSYTPVIYPVPSFYLGGYKGTITLKYHVLSGSGQRDVSEPLEIEIDREPPGNGAAPVPLQFPAAMGNKVTLRYLDDNQDQVIATVPAYTPMEAGQTVSLWWNGKRTTAVAPVVVTAEDVTNGTVQIVIPGAQFRNLTDERVMLQYSLSNRAGFESYPSESSTIMISLDPEPANLKDPVVPLAADGLIDLADANQGVEIKIDAYTNIMTGDTIVAHWGNSPLNPEAVVANNFPVFVSVPRSVVLKEGSGSIPVYYEVMRGGAATKSNTIQVNVDVMTVGPVDPDPTTPVNEALQIPWIQGGSKIHPLNELGIQDKGKTATATIPFFQSPQGKPAEPIITTPGAQITLLWGAYPGSQIPIGPFTVTQAHLDAQELPVITIPASAVDAAPDGNGFEVYYTLSRPAGDTVRNPVSSPSAKLTIKMNIPGGPDGLLAPKIMGTTAKNWITKETIQARGGVKIKVDPYSGMKVDDVVQLQWIAFSSLTNAPGTEIAATKYTSEHIVKTVDITNGLEFSVPYTPYVEQIAVETGNQRQGSATATYTVTQNGDTYASKVATVKIELSSPAGN